MGNCVHKFSAQSSVLLRPVAPKFRLVFILLLNLPNFQRFNPKITAFKFKTKESGGASRVFRARARHHLYVAFCAYRRADAVFPVLRARADPYERQDRVFVSANAIFVSAC